ncbi:Uncharacterized damage-inducible protein DinB (forms a four-helix bundle) [Ectothiorhodospira magna]|uniref:Uncharacterized damage-inducible protein DinB (Forms a four-helix bundle) n=1 Tax=Ectothiorhodospira magna TaxID=867345 RepID=A0A1H9BDL0_9GAMM|nr:DinB family protein [Ectothiorhodospira magna]SEP86975.1 Uncharacterized damage-inducible protein DinB (forms a four-helix bundle) [Ectothiorhodospira magna]
MDILYSLRLQARFNRWCNQRILDWCDDLRDEDRKREIPGPRPWSLHNLLNQALLQDRVWLGHMLNRPHIHRASDQMLYTDYALLCAERQRTDGEIINFVQNLAPPNLDRPLTFRHDRDQREYTLLVGDCLLGMFHNQSLQRGRMTVLLSQLDVSIGTLDIGAMPGIID